MLTKSELDELRPWVTAMLQGGRGEVVEVALQCIGGSLSRQASSEKLMPLLGSATGGFVDALYRKVLEIKSAKLASSGSGGITGKRPFSSTADDESDQLSKRKKSRFEGGSMHSDVQNMLASTLKQIEERRRQTQTMLIQPGLLPTPSSGTSTAINDAVAKAKRAAELQARIQSQLVSKSVGLLPTVAATAAAMTAGGRGKAASKPVPLVLDAEGKVDIPMAVRQPTLKANIRAQQRAQFRQINKEQRTKDDDVVETPYFDPRVTQLTAGRGRRTLKFNEPGKYIKQAQTMRAKAQLEKLQSEIASTARKTGISSATKLALLAPGAEALVDDVPAVEWWDADVLHSRSYIDLEKPLPREQKYHGISNLIEHPIPVQPAGVPKEPVVVPLLLTKKERKKIRKQQRRERELEVQEKIRLGLAEKPEPKVRISNLMRVLGNDAVQDPTKVEALVRAQMAERQRKHEQANEARKLTPNQRRAKKIKKLYEDAAKGIHVAVFRVNDLSNQSNRFKVDMNAQQLHLTGCCLVYHDINVVVVEGGAKGLKKYKKLMLHRIKWSPDLVPDEDSDNEQTSSSKPRNTCTLVWEGVREDRSFSDWKMTLCKSETAARELLKRNGAEHYWDMALSESIVENEQD